jgi:hypothetical protein
MNRLTAILILLLSLSLSSLPAEQRVALVIGNASYESAPLDNPANDARDMSAVLKDLGFSVKTLIDASNSEMYQAIREFGRDLARAEVGLFYFAGHGMQVDGANYLIPVGADIQAEEEIRFNAIDTNLILTKMDRAGAATNILILDACRDNPFARSFRSASRGLAVVEAPRGSLVVYATAPGSIAADGKGRNGIFTGALLEHIAKPGVDVEIMLRDVRRDVMAETDNKQVPWSSSSLTTAFFFSPEEKEPEERLTEEKRPERPVVGQTQPYREDFSSFASEKWELDGNWRIVREGNQSYLSGRGDYQWARCFHQLGSSFILEFRARLIKRFVHFVVRLSEKGHYTIYFTEEDSGLHKNEWPDTYRKDLRFTPAEYKLGRWYHIAIEGDDDTIIFRVNGWEQWSFRDEEPLRGGIFAFQTLKGTEVHIDDIVVSKASPR